MKRIIMALVIGLALTACSSKESTPPTEPTPTQPNQNNTPTEPATTEDVHMKYVTDYGFTNVSNVNGTKVYQTYKLDETTAVDPEVYNQWMYSWVNPADYVGKEIKVYQYTGTKDNTEHDIYTITANDEVIGGYYYATGGAIESANILHTEHKVNMADEFMAKWNETFNINK